MRLSHLAKRYNLPPEELSIIVRASRTEVRNALRQAIAFEMRGQTFPAVFNDNAPWIVKIANIPIFITSLDESRPEGPVT